MGLAMAFPSTIFISAWGSMHLYKIGLISQFQAVLIFLAIISNVLFMMVYYAFKRKD